MRFVLAPRRLAILLHRFSPELAKSFSRGPTAGHKYVRRERAFVGGHLTWRYFYRDTEQKHAHAAAIDPAQRHEHYTLAEVPKLYPNLKGKVMRAADATIDAIKRLFGWGEKAPKDFKMSATLGWNAVAVTPFIIAQEGKDDVERSPQARVAKALELIPEHLKELVSEGSEKGERMYKGLRDVELTTMVEDPYTRDRLLGGAIIAGYASPLGDLRITDAAISTPTGVPRYGSPQTLTEEVVIHEFGHHVHFKLEGSNPDVISQWQKLGEGGSQRISTYAYTNWKEDWAETFAAAISQPKELARDCPERYDFMREHVIPELRERAEILRVPDEELAWWNPTPQTPATRALQQLKLDRPARKFYPYYSDKDQFYLLSKNGRTAYVRFGPPDKNAEAGWERMPATVDPETGLPRYEGSVFTRFNQQQAFKEIYDERGNALDSKQAWLYLGQDDEKVIEHVNAVVGEQSPNAYGELIAGKTDDNAHLGRKMFDSLGGNLQGYDLDKERARVKKAREKGASGVLERHDWAPVEISAREFVEKSGTFKFGGVAEAREQPSVIADYVGGKRVVRTYQDPVLGTRPVLSVRVYEQVNPDGTRTKIRVHEDSSFVAGETILAPQATRGDDGEPATRWLRYEIKPSDSTDPQELARAFGTTARALLEHNQRYGRGQIVDPVMSALINPGGRRQIRCAADLQELMRVAAESDPPRRTWVSIVGGGREVGTQAVSHIQVEWDGAGPPKVVGDYWARKLGLAEVRVDQLLDRLDKIKLERIREKAPHARPVERGAVVWVIDPKTSRRVHARLVGEKDVEGKKQFEVQPLPGQGAGVSKVVVTVPSVRPLSSADIAGQVGAQRRLVEPLEHDVLLYADEVPHGSGPLDPGGVIRILLPKDGSVTYEQVKRLPGVQDAREGAENRIYGAGGKLQVPLGISVDDIPRFRDALGGFVMDSRVRVMLDRAIQIERARAEQREATPVVKPEDIVDENGNINPEGVLKGLVTGSEGIQPGPHRVKALQALARNNGRLIAAHFMGCIGGDALVEVEVPGESPPVRVERVADLARNFERREMYSTSLFVDELSFGRNALLEAFPSGLRRTLLLRTEDGRSIRATEDHPFYTSCTSRPVPLREIYPGSSVLVRVAGKVAPIVDVVTFVGDAAEEETYDLIMKEPARNYVANGFVVSNTGKTAYAIMAAQMMRNLKDASGNPHPNQVKKKTIIVVPLNTAENWWQEYKRFAGEPPTLLGASTLAGAQQVPKLPARKQNESDALYRVRVLDAWREALKTQHGLWDPFSDAGKNVVIGSEYFRDHGEALRMTGLFDGMVVDEAHEIARENETSREVERWNPDMKMWLALTGTPIMNTLDVVPRLVRLVTANQVDLGSEAQFTEKYLMASAVLKAHGIVAPPKIDLNPMRAGELAAILQPLMDVATTADVKGQAMPAVLLDENEPAHMIGQQARMYRAAMAKLSDAEREALALSASLGLDEKQMLGDEARARVEVARSTANCPAYKAPDLREELLYEARVVQKKGSKDVVTTQQRPFRLPDYREVSGKGGWRGRWPSSDDVAAGRVEATYLAALEQHSDHIFGRDYGYMAGQPIEPAVLEKIKAGTYVTATGQAWGAKVLNPDYGPEGAIARGVVDEVTGDVLPLQYRFSDELGHEVVRQIPTGTRFVRDPNAKAAGLFYHQDDWDATGRFADGGEGTAATDAEDEDESKKKGARGQGPRAGRADLNVQRSPARREQRAQFDVVMTHNNAKCDKLEHWMKNVLSGKTGDPNAESAQFILFGNRIGSSVRTMESKLRTMGYQDVNEALGPAAWSSEADKAVTPRKYFVTYMGKSATLGDRNLNSEIFRRVQDEVGRDMGVSMFVQRMVYGNASVKPIKLGEVREGWGRTERKKISENFVDGGAPLEAPMRVRGVLEGQNVVPHYAYESDLRPRERAEVRALEVQMRGVAGAARDKLQARLDAVLEPHYTARAPLSARAQHVYNNCQVMVASDAANVGLNWPAGYLGMYDSLFSPMGEWQRITRAARMLPAAVSKGLKPIVGKLDALIKEHEATYSQAANRQGPDARVDYDEGTAMNVVHWAINKLEPADRAVLDSMEGGRPDQLVEAYFARRALDRIDGLREAAATKLKSEGFRPNPNAPPSESNWISPVAVTDIDVNNYIVRELLSPFEKKMMKARRYLVDVQRFTTSVDMPVLKTIVLPAEEEGGKKRRIRVQTTGMDGQPLFEVESPSQAEKSTLVQQRAKQKPYEFFMKVVQNAQPAETRYDFVPANQKSLALTSLSGTGDVPADYLADEGVHFMVATKQDAVDRVINGHSASSEGARMSELDDLVARRRALETLLQGLGDGTWYLVVPDARGSADASLGAHATEHAARVVRGTLPWGGTGSVTERVTVHRGAVTVRKRLR